MSIKIIARAHFVKSSRSIFPGTPLNRLLAILIVSTCFLTAAGARNAWSQSPDPKPPQVSVAFFFPPSPLVQHGISRLVYEMRISNYPPISYDLDSIEVSAGSKKFSYSGAELLSMERFLGEKKPTATTHHLAGGQSAIVYFMLDFAKPGDIPDTLEHTLHFRSSDGVHHALTAPPLVVGKQAPVVIAAPLRGDHWLAGDSVHNGVDAAHRRTILLLGGEPWLAQRYAIDWVRYRMNNGTAVTWSGKEDENSSYICYGEPIHSVADGKVVEALDGIRENIPHSGKYAVSLNFINAGGNHVVVDIGNNRYVFYAHMRPETLTVKVGDQVKTGQILGHVGNTGSSTEPHLHIHIVDRPSFLAGQGIPYEFASFDASGSPEMIEKPHDEMAFRNFGAFQQFHNDYPATNAAVNFP